VTEGHSHPQGGHRHRLGALVTGHSHDHAVHLTDRAGGVVSLAVLLGAGGLAVGWRWADPVVSLAVTVVILGILRTTIREIGGRLLDAVDPALVASATVSLEAVAGVDGVRELRVRWIGHTLRAEADVLVDPALTVGEAHALAHRAETQLITDVARLSAATIHVSPRGVHHG